MVGEFLQASYEYQKNEPLLRRAVSPYWLSSAEWLALKKHRLMRLCTQTYMCICVCVTKIIKDYKLESGAYRKDNMEGSWEQLEVIKGGEELM